MIFIANIKYQLFIILLAMSSLLVIALPMSSYASDDDKSDDDKSDTCKGRFVNPITDICWGCMMPITMGGKKGLKIGHAEKAPIKPRYRDTKNPDDIICGCSPDAGVVPIPGITAGFWEPIRLVDVTRTPYCMVNLGGLSIKKAKASKLGGFSKGYGKTGTNASFYHLHYYVYPLIYWLELITDVACVEKSSFDVAYMSEFDISWNDQKMQSLLNPEAILFGNPIAQFACVADCAAATFSTGLDSMFWCAGCYGNIYPFSGANADHVGGVQNSSLLTTRILAKMHRVGLGLKTITDDAEIDGPICNKARALKLVKSQYKLQLVNPKTTADDEKIGCWPLGMTDTAYSSFNEYPYDGQDWGYLIWRKKNCCMF